MERLRATTERAFQIQRQLLEELVIANRETAFGKKHHFSEIRSLQEYQNTVPITNYEVYDSYVEALLRGKKNQLTKEPPVYYSLSSGSTGSPKYVPLTERDIDIHHCYAYGAVYGMIREYYRDLAPEEIFGKIFQTGEFTKTSLEDGQMSGIRSSSLYQWMDRDETFDCSDYTAPREILFPQELRNMTYAKVRFALAQRDVSALHSVFINRLTDLLRYIENNWEMLLHDMADGTVDERVEMEPEWKAWICAKLPPNPQRAEELRKTVGSPSADGLLLRIWPQMKYVLTIGGGTFSFYMEELARFAAEVPIHYFAYAASEGIFGVADGLNRPDAYILLPEAGIFEFLPEDGGAGQKPLLMNEVRSGQKYELIFTNHSGLYRYAMNDVVQVTGFFGEAPIVRVCYRKNQLPGIADVRISADVLDMAVQKLLAESHLICRDYCLRTEQTGRGSRYCVLMELEDEKEALRRRPTLERLLESALEDASFDYRSCRRLGEIQPLRVGILRKGSFAEYECFLEKRKILTGQTKPLRVLDTEEKQQFFEQRLVGI